MSPQKNGMQSLPVSKRLFSFVLIRNMPRIKKYKEDEVIEKAMNLFWRNGYASTSTRMLEKEMGINQFSIYSSFGNKHGIFIKSLKCYKSKIRGLLDKLQASSNGIEDIKQFFYDFIDFSRENTFGKGCLLTSTVNELGSDCDEEISSEITNFITSLRALFINKLQTDTGKDNATIAKQANYLIIAKQGLSIASKVFNHKELEDFIECTFKNIK